MARGITLSRGRASGFDLPRAEEEVVSLASSFDTDKETFEPRIPVREEKRPTSTSSPSLTLAGVPEYETPEESLNNLASFVEQQQGQSSALSAAAVESGDYSGIKGADVNKLRQDPRNVRDYYTESVDTNIVDFVEDNDIPLFKEVNGQKLYLNTGTSGSIAGIAKEGSDVVYQAYGPVGTYSTVAVPKDRSISGAFPPIVRTALAIYTGGASESVLSAANALSGQTLTTADWLNLATGAYQLSQLPSTPTGTTGTTAPRTPAEMAADGDIVSATSSAADAVDAVVDFNAGDAAIQAAFDSGVLDVANLDTDLYQQIWEGASLSSTPLLTAADVASVASTVAADQNAKRIADAKAAEEAARAAAEAEARRAAAEAEAKRQAEVTVTGGGGEVEDNIAAAISDILLDRAMAEERVKEPDPVITIGEDVFETGVTPETPPTPAPVITPEIVTEPIVADPIEVVIPPPVIPTEDESEAGGGADGGADSGSAGAGISAEGEGTPEENPIFRQVYEAVLAETDADVREGMLEDYIRMGGIFVDELRRNVPADDVYGPATTETAPTAEELAAEAAEATETGEEEEDTDPLTFLDIFAETTDDDTIGLPTDTTVDTGTTTTTTTTTTPTGTTPATDATSGTPSDTTPVDGTTGTTDAAGTTGTTGTTGTGDGTGDGDGTDDGTGTGDGDGDGDGNGNGNGSGRGSGSGIGTGVGAASGTRTTDSLFGDMLKLETQVGSTQELVPFSLAPVPELMPFQYQEQRPLQQFTQPRMLTNESGLQINIPPRQLTQEELLQQWIDSQKVSL